MKTKNAVVQLGAGPVQSGLLDRIEACGLATIVVDRAAAPAGAHASSLHVRAPIDDPAQIVPGLTRLAKERPDLEIAAVLTSTDLGVTSVPRVAASLGLPHASLGAIERMDDKERAKTTLSTAGVPVPAGHVGTSLRDLEAALELGKHGEEIVIKPADSSGSRGVRRVCGAEAIRGAISNALQFGDRFLAEECIEGAHLDINGFVRDGRFELVSIGRRFFSEAPRCVPLFGILEPHEDDAIASRVRQTMQRAVAAFDYQHGPVKADAIDTQAGLVVLELAARFHGDVFSFHLSDAAGRGPAALHWLASLGLAPPLPSPPSEHARGLWFAVFAESSGTIESIEGLDRFHADPAFWHWIPRLSPGDAVGVPEDNRALVGFGLMRAEPGQDPAQVIRAAQAGIRVRLQADSRHRTQKTNRGAGDEPAKLQPRPMPAR